MVAATIGGRSLHPMTLFGQDASNFDAARGPMNMVAIGGDGMTWVTHKATEGVTVVHDRMGPVLTHARDAGIPFLGAYHVVRSGPSSLSQVAFMLVTLDRTIPWWRTHPGFFLQVDLEKWPYDQVSAATGKAFAAALTVAQRKRVITYASRGQYGNDLAGIVTPLWNANYPSNRSGPYRGLYPGDTGPGWSAYSGQIPAMWQYTSSATIDGQTGCDANAFRGDHRALTALLTGGPMTVEKTAGDVFDLIARIINGMPMPAPGVPSAIPSWVTSAASKADLAGVAADVRAGRVAVEALSAAIAVAGGSVDVSAVLAHMDAIAAADTAREVAFLAQIAALQAELAALQASIIVVGADVKTGMSPSEVASSRPGG